MTRLRLVNALSDKLEPSVPVDKTDPEPPPIGSDDDPCEVCGYNPEFCDCEDKHGSS